MYYFEFLAIVAKVHQMAPNLKNTAQKCQKLKVPALKTRHFRTVWLVFPTNSFPLTTQIFKYV